MEKESAEGNGKMGVEYTVKELLSNLNIKIDRIESKLDNKVDRSELEVLTTRIIVLESKRAASDALKAQTEEINRVYLRQFENVQSDVQELKEDRKANEAVAKDKDNWKILWFPIIANSIGLALLIYFTVIK